ncbi:molybdate ABC transporter substrate-binding protein [Comamonas sp. JC664]|uniref:molybdate ABC transporter substrate-binding protein n=1 Tax=Comamonas sp. JC664 TaxID=2801917 RepID=UPI0017491C7C|nr:molybdate ABC transporter substrate-binding protein [Comamonas sp. JC664]MBL0694920.1 molybdate ABC transporter substrate-binding protein [Comamonas sp. JC664]GHG95268.1 molybdate ABC transporter substrate-binding protein [Comamonas sp. KCTC 72670]
MRHLTLLCAVVALLAGPFARADKVLVFAAVSTTDALQELAPAFKKATGHTVEFSLGASSDLARQVIAGAPADVFLSADEAQMDAVEKAGLVAPSTRVDLLSNRLVVVVPADVKAQLSAPAGLRSLKRLSLADPEAVPAGVYAKAWLMKVGLWEALEPKVVPALNVRAALAAVETGRVDAGVVYSTDAAHSKRVRVAFQVPEQDVPRIVYPAAVLTRGDATEAARAYVRFLQSDAARKVFARHGFGVPAAAPGTRAP